MLAKKLLSAVTAVAIALSPAMAGPAMLFDPATGKVLYAEDQDDQWFPASLTKIMTASLVSGARGEGKIPRKDRWRAPELAHGQPPSRLGLPVGTEISVETALHAMIIKSANDAAVMLAEGVAGSEDAFAARMNATAQ